ncbi:MAG: hypothetical protein KIC85_00730 [Enterococcus gilvus]|nr:hypothetical protein [Enterococcus gilvus]
MRIKDFFSAVPDEFKKGANTLIGWTIPIAIVSLLFFSFKTIILFPEFSPSEVSVKKIKDLSVITPENNKPAGHEAGYVEDGKLIEPVWHGVPDLEFSIKGKGKIKSASLFYTYKNGRTSKGKREESTFVKQSVAYEDKLFGFYIKPYTLKSNVNLVNYSDSPMLFYLGIVSEVQNNKYIYAIQYENNGKSTIYSEKDIIDILQYSQEEGKEFISWNKEIIQSDITRIKEAL